MTERKLADRALVTEMLTLVQSQQTGDTVIAGIGGFDLEFRRTLGPGRLSLHDADAQRSQHGIRAARHHHATRCDRQARAHTRQPRRRTGAPVTGSQKPSAGWPRIPRARAACSPSRMTFRTSASSSPKSKGRSHMTSTAAELDRCARHELRDLEQCLRLRSIGYAFAGWRLSRDLTHPIM